MLLAVPVVVTDNVAVTAEEPLKVTGDVTVHTDPGGHPTLTPRLTDPENPLRGVIVIVAVPDCPGAGMLMLPGLTETAKSVTLTVTGAEVEPA